jgi:NAD(P)-dependent dehydrogenase (short-subunit alcohol dehydrogenase family)
MSGTRTAIVTGGASGIGAACVRRFLKDGITVVALDLNEDLLKEMKATLGDHNLYIVVGDVTKVSDRKRTIDVAVDKGGSLDVLVNNAAVFLLSGIDATRDQWQKTFEVISLLEQISSPILLPKCARVHMRQSSTSQVSLRIGHRLDVGPTTP